MSDHSLVAVAPANTGGRTATVLVHLSRGLDPHAWQERHRRGEVPDAWPYGLDRLAHHGFDVTAVRPRVRREALPARALRPLGGYEWWETAAVLRDGREADLRLCWDERSGVPAALLSSRGRRRPAVVTGVIWLTDVSGRPRGAMLAAPRALRAAHRVWTSSSAQVPVLRDVFSIPERRLRHIPFGVDADFFRPAESPPAPGLVVGVGNDRHRDHETLLAGMARAHREVPHARLELVTSREIQVPERLGRRHSRLAHSAIMDLYARACVVVVALHPNVHVSGSTVLLEAMACGRPVIVTGNPGIADYVEHGVNGLLVPPGDADAVAGAVTELLVDPDRAAEMGRAGRTAVEREFNTEVQASRLADLLRES